MTDLIYRQTAIDTANTMYERCDTGSIEDYHDLMVEALKVLPAADTDFSDFCDRLYKGAYERGKVDAESEIAELQQKVKAQEQAMLRVVMQLADKIQTEDTE